MTHRLTDERLDREIRDFLAREAGSIADAPSALEMSARVGSRVGASPVRRVAPSLARVVLAGLVVTALAAAAVGGAMLLRASPVRSYEAVFLRFDELPSSDLLVIGVDAEGRERSIATLEDARLMEGPPAGVVSTSALLAIPRPLEGRSVGWEIVDLRRPDADPVAIAGIIQDVDQLNETPFYTTEQRPSPFWGPGERLALPWYERTGEQQWYWSFVEGRSGATTTVDRPDDELTVLPAWASDGSGVLVGNWCDDSGCDVWDIAATGVLRPDGTVAAGVVAVAPGASSRRYRSDGAMLSGSLDRVLDDGFMELVDLDGGEITDAAWTAEGDGVWLAVRSSIDDPDLRIDRVVPPAAPVTVATLQDAAREPAGSRLQGHFIGLAPDDSMLVVSLDRVTGTADNGSMSPVSAAGLVVPYSGASFAIGGSFAGWMEVE